MAADGATRDQAIARIWLGSAFSLTVADAVILGHLTGRGPSDPSLNQEWRNAGNEPYSVRFGDARPAGYRQAFEPFGMIAGTIADTISTMKFARDPERAGLGMSLIYGVGNA